MWDIDDLINGNVIGIEFFFAAYNDGRLIPNTKAILGPYKIWVYVQKVTDNGTYNVTFRPERPDGTNECVTFVDRDTNFYGEDIKSLVECMGDVNYSLRYDTIDKGTVLRTRKMMFGRD